MIYWIASLYWFILAANTFFYATCYRGRGGGYISFKVDSTKSFFYINSDGTFAVNFGGTTVARLFWWCVIPGFILWVITLLSPPMYDGISFFAILLYFVLQYVTVLEPFSHGKYETIEGPPNPAQFEIADLFMPKVTAATNYMLYNCAALAIVGFFRGLILTIPLCLISDWFLLTPLFYAMMGPMYYVGKKLPTFNIYGVKGGDTENSEWLVGWVVGLGVSIAVMLNYYFPSMIVNKFVSSFL